MTNRIAIFTRNMPGNIDAVLISAPLNRLYYTGFASSAGTLLITREKSVLIIDGRYFEAAQESVKNCEVVLQDKLYEQVSEFLVKQSVKTLGLEAEYVSIAEYTRIKGRLADFTVSDAGGISEIIAEQRSIKDSGEIEKMQKSQNITDKIFSRILNYIRPGVTELEIAGEMQSLARGLGAVKPAFDFIVASGENSSKPHAVPTGRKIKNGDFIVLDFGVIFEDYCSDMTRTVGVGRISPKQREAYGLVLKSQKAALLAIKPGENCRDADAAARDIIDSGEYKGLCGHGIGHALGLEVHEPPSFSKTSGSVIKPGHVMSVEPGIYIPGEFGIRIEDVVAVKQDGFINLTHSPKELIVL